MLYKTCFGSMLYMLLGMLWEPWYMIPGMFFVTWQDMGTQCDKVKKIVGKKNCNNTFVLALTTMGKYNVRGNNRLVWKYWNTRTKLVWSEVDIRPTLSLNFELGKRGRAKIWLEACYWDISTNGPLCACKLLLLLA